MSDEVINQEHGKLLAETQRLFAWAKLAVEVQAYDDVTRYLNLEKAMHFYTSRKKMIYYIKALWRVLSAIKQHVYNSRNQIEMPKLQKYITPICNDVLKTLSTDLIPNTKVPVLLVIYLQMKGDFRRYLAEVATGKRRKTLVAKANRAYSDALQVATARLKCTDPIRLEIILNYSVFYDEMMNSTKIANQLANYHFMEAMPAASANTLQNRYLKDGILRLLWEKLKEWDSKFERLAYEKIWSSIF